MQDWHSEDIKCELKKRRLSLQQLSRDSGLAPSTLRNALRAPYLKGEKIIAAALGVDAREIWPSRYKHRG